MEQTKNEPTVESVLLDIKALPERDFLMLLSKLFGLSSLPAATLTSFASENRFTDGVVCPYCSKKHVRLNGHRKDGAQKYVCAECGKSFTAHTNTITAGSSKPLDTWRKYIACMVNGLPVREAAAKCGMADTTSFAWWHKNPDAQRNMCEGVTLSGIIM